MGDNIVKAFDGNRFGGYLILWGDQRHKDITGEYFSPKTSEIDVVLKAVGKLPVLYHHASDPSMKSTVIGTIDSMKSDAVGVWVEGQATKAEQYKTMVMPLIQQGLLAWSSGTFPKAKEVKDGQITRWPVIEGSMTPTPAEFRMIVDHPIQVVKAAFTEVGLDSGYLDGYVKAVLDLEFERIAVLELEEVIKTYDESEHPRYPKGHPKGGQFMPSDNPKDMYMAMMDVFQRYLGSDSGFSRSPEYKVFAKKLETSSDESVEKELDSVVQTYVQSQMSKPYMEKFRTELQISKDAYAKYFTYFVQKDVWMLRDQMERDKRWRKRMSEDKEQAIRFQRQMGL